MKVFISDEIVAKSSRRPKAFSAKTGTGSFFERGCLQGTGFIARGRAGAPLIAESTGGGSSLLAGRKARGGGLSPMGSESATWCGLVGGLTERERGTVCAGRASALLRGACCGGPFSATRADYVPRQTHVFHERGIRVRRGAVAARGAELLWVLALWAAG